MIKFNFLALSLILVTFFNVGCTQEDDDEDKGIYGTWHLSNVSGGLAGINLDYERGEVTWEFKVGDKLEVENNILTDGPKSIFAGLETGVYSFSVTEYGGDQTLNIDGQYSGSVEIGTTLRLDEGVDADGFLKSFVR
mgnify:CR=1 FL=1